MTTPGRRTLHYNRLDDVMPDVERLFAGHIPTIKLRLDPS
jgi:hypothetical protein